MWQALTRQTGSQYMPLLSLTFLDVYVADAWVYVQNSRLFLVQHKWCGELTNFT
jgi:hypothetical protein